MDRRHPDPSQGPCGSAEPRDPASTGHSSPRASVWPSEGSAGDSEVSRDMSEAFTVAQVQIRKQNAITERERRKRISVSCERLRILLPKFEGRREDMASILEMAVQYLKLVRTLVPTEEQNTILAPSEEVCQKWQKNVLIPNTRKQISEMKAFDTARQRGSLGYGTTPVGNSKSALMLGESVDDVLGDICSIFEKAFPLETAAVRRWPSLVGLCPGEVTSQAQLLKHAHEPSDILMTPTLDTRSMSESEIEDEMPFLLGAHTDQWLGEQGPHDGKSGETETYSMTTPLMMDAKMSSQDGFLTKSDLEFLPGPDSCLPEPQKTLLDHLEFDSPSVALNPQDEVDSIFPYLFPYEL
ncbi:spermatogenesis- and oogenesis-specific basic helix-loop-helix-containing protein 1 isoform X2 [Monodelphis domestica]|uniref:spermatogenesis- and oogenesis-specific basic helix-loop-helix-containing protein 1 isoform X2 n=1 Tax=Monodelphis domestica TaxID=13616 RepID=UPI0024E20384|nr:spermatogenesis- and oogenesis-specific basic helix-loop-helix-containing protein 1 isoform X2 [Monodelphis domestica]